MTDKDLVARIARSPGGKAGYKQLVRELGLGGGRERRLLLEQLARLTARGQLARPDRDTWSIPRPASGTRDNLIAGRLDLHRDGYGFVRPNARQASAPTDDIFIPPGELAGAMQGDQVLVELDPPRADGRASGRIARILERRNSTVVGVFHYARGQRYPANVVLPFDERMSQPIVIPPGAELPSSTPAATPHRVLGSDVHANPRVESPEGLVVDVEITRWPTPFKPAEGRVIEILGHPDDFGVDVEMMIRKHQLPRIFPDNVLAEARSVAHLDTAEVARRADFRDLPIVTIDGETAKDFDDAVLVHETAHGYELQVHIADVAHYVRPASDLDLEARLRGTSVYFPDRAIPMLPQELSTNICSLRPDEDRLVLSCIMQLDDAGRILSYEIVEGVIRSAARMTYTSVHAILEGDAATRARYAELVPHFERMHRLAQLMNKRREARGSIDFDLPEPVIEFDDNGQMRGVTKSERTWANRLIEEFMLAANECVATWLEDLGVPSLYRIHEKPDPRRVVQFEELAAGFGYSLGLGALPVKRVVTRQDRRDAQRSGRSARTHEVPEDIAVTPRMYQKLAARIEGKPEERILSYLMLRSLKQARYSETNEGHFALAAPTYTHFTSPIRRYPDLIVHRITKALLRAGIAGQGHVPEGRHASPWTHPSEGRVPHAAPGPVPHLRRGSIAPKVGEYAAEQEILDNPLSRKAGSHMIDPPIPESELAQIADETSQTERRAAEAERELVEWKKVRFMQDRVGEEFAALVLNPSKYGLFVELTDLFVEGLVPIDTLRDDRYTFRENSHEVIGERWGRRFRAGDRVHVILDRILAQERKLQFSIVDEGIPLTGKRPPRPPAKSKKKRDIAAPPAKKKKFAKKRRH
ncbi:MAG: VacB/RNase II family 3'-5' exoribonuclease [Acidobacteriota bacterium]|nr:VacB/RNase II family 3'-5' exoribonuclease [Acidobacteriota bacterium]